MNKFIIIPLLLTGVVSLTAATAAGTIQEPAPADSAYAAEPAVPGAFFGTSQARTTGAVSTVDGVSLGKTTAPNLTKLTVAGLPALQPGSWHDTCTGWLAQGKPPFWQ